MFSRRKVDSSDITVRASADPQICSSLFMLAHGFSREGTNIAYAD